MHTGYSGKGPLGNMAGFLLHNGTSTKDPILAAAGDESQAAFRVYSSNTDSVILMPSMEPCATSKPMVTERMRVTTLADYSVVFCFSVENDDKMGLEKFEWRKLKKGDDNIAKKKKVGFDCMHVVRLTSALEKTSFGETIDNSSVHEDFPSLLGGKEGEIVALLT